MIIIRFISCVVPNTDAYYHSWSKYFIDLAWTIVWLALTLSFFGLLFFGTLLETVGYSQDKVQANVLEMI